MSPTNLISLLKTVHHAWQHQAITESAHRVRALGAELYDRLRTMTERLVDLGTHLDRAVRSYDQLGASFERRVLVSARKFREMGAAGSREIPEVQEVGHRVRELATSPTRVEEELEEGGLKEPQ